ncbi:MAG: PqqD family protein [Kiritimatiellia bacterium]
MRYRTHPDVVARSIAGESILVPLNEPARRIFTLSTTGRALWDRLEQDWATPEELEALLVERFKGPPGQVKTDVAAFLASMSDFRLVIAEPKDSQP